MLQLWNGCAARTQCTTLPMGVRLTSWQNVSIACHRNGLTGVQRSSWPNLSLVGRWEGLYLAPPACKKVGAILGLQTDAHMKWKLLF